MMEALALVLIVVLAAGAAGMGAWALSHQQRVRRLERELGEARHRMTRLEKLGALGEMASSFAHTFNDVLTPILGRTQLLSQRINDPQLREWLDTIERSALDGAQSIRKIQEFLRQRRVEAPAAVDLSAVVREAVAATSQRRRPGVHVKTEVDTVPLVAGDPLGLREAVEHLIVNAVEAAPDGSTVTVAARTENGDAVVSVRDSGLGMTPGVQARIFEPFFTTKPGASGLGLTLAYGIVSRHGAQLDVDTAPGGGTSVRIRFPVEGVSRPAIASTASARRPVAPGPRSHCLVVDDDSQVREMIRDILSNAGHNVVTAMDGSEGVEKFKADSFDLVITDLAMPKLNGLQLARVCKTLRPAVPVVLLTGWGVLLTEDELSEHGVDEVLSKPVRLDQVLGAVAAVRARAAGT
jgi:CheY-like chemotaxis protein/nitrogen-specific signal transduction histidine kinase